MTKESLEDYRDMIAELAEIEKELHRTHTEIVADTVKGSSLEFPYTEHTVCIRGVVSDKELLDKKRHLLETLQKKKAEIEDFMFGLPTSRQRRIVRFRIVDGLTWDQVAAKMGYRESAASCKMIYNRIFEKK